MTSISTSGQSPYLPPAVTADARHSASLNLIFDPFSIDFFPFDKIQNGDHILFAECGNGKLVVKIAKEIKNRGLDVHIVAFDISEQQLDYARVDAQNQEVDNINWIRQDASDLSLFKGKFNVVHTRFLLTSLSNAKEATIGLCKAVTTDGIFVCEEFSGVEIHVLPEKQESIEVQYACQQLNILLSLSQGHNIAFAKRLPSILSKIDMIVSKSIEPKPVASTKEQKNLMSERCTLAPKILSTYFHSCIEPLIKKFEEMRDADNCSITFNDFTQIIAEKSPSKPQTPQLIFRLV